MKLAEALQINESARAQEDAAPFHAALCCGFTPLHLEHFLAAHLHRKLEGRSVDWVPMPYGDAVECLNKVDKGVDAVFLLIEWQDLDPRLGIRSADWRPSLAGDILETARLRLKIIGKIVAEIAASIPLQVSLPSLPTPAILPSSRDREDRFRTDLEVLLLEFRLQLLEISKVDLLARSPGHTATSPYDLKGDLRFGTPYSVTFQGRLADKLVKLAFPPPPLKGIITDLDDTLWRGIIGEVGAHEIHWDLDRHSHIHALYQQQLRALSERGILLAIASKNDPTVAERGLCRPDLVVDPDLFFPKEIHWEPKSTSVTRILRTWNIGADSVLMIDDSESELAEVKAVHPEIETRRFPTGDDVAALELISDLPELFAKNTITEEDRLRSITIRSRADHLETNSGTQVDSESFLRNANAEVRFEKSTPEDTRAFDLLNKTNQFNINGRRLSKKEWFDLHQRKDTAVLTADYKDKFGKLGKIAVISASHQGDLLQIDHWVISCRAFSRRLEHLCLKVLFDEFKVGSLRFAYRETPRNQPVGQLFELLLGEPSSGELILEKKVFFDHCPPLYSKVDSPHEF